MKKPAKLWQRGDKAFVKIAGKPVAALILDVAGGRRGSNDVHPVHNGQAKIKIAMQSALDGTWHFGTPPRIVAFKELSPRSNYIEGFDFE